jgi:hypothetical protein
LHGTEEGWEDGVLAHSIKVGNVTLHQQLSEVLQVLLSKLEGTEILVQEELVVL